MTTHASFHLALVLALPGCFGDPAPPAEEQPLDAKTFSADAGISESGPTATVNSSMPSGDFGDEQNAVNHDPANPLGSKWLGEKCTASAECDSGHCTDGVCCNTTACGSCETCAGQFQEGGCSFVPAPYPDPKSCTGTNVCDGQGACKRQPGAACAADAECATGHCTDGVCCSTPCQEQCFSCNQPGKEGLCTLIDCEEDVSPAVMCAGVFDDDGYGTTAEPPPGRCNRSRNPPVGYAASGRDEFDTESAQVCP